MARVITALSAIVLGALCGELKRIEAAMGPCRSGAHQSSYEVGRACERIKTSIDGWLERELGDPGGLTRNLEGECECFFGDLRGAERHSAQRSGYPPAA